MFNAPKFASCVVPHRARGDSAVVADQLGQELYVRQLARLSFLSLHTVQEELAKLYAADLVLSRTNGYHRFYRANPKHPLYPALRQVVIKAASQPRPALRTKKRVGTLKHVRYVLK